MRHRPTHRPTLRHVTNALRPTLPSHTTGHFWARTRRSVTSRFHTQSVSGELAPGLPERLCI